MIRKDHVDNIFGIEMRRLDSNMVAAVVPEAMA